MNYWQKIKNNKEPIFKVMIVASYFILLFVWSLNQDFGNGPEEKIRFSMPQFMFKNGRLPTLFDKSLYDDYYRISYAGQPFFPYIIGSVFMRIVSFFSNSEFALLMSARFVSILCGVLFSIIIIKIADELFDSSIIKVMFTLIIIFWRYTCYLFTYVNCDSMMMVGCALIVLYSIKGLKNNWGFKECIGLSIGVSLILLSYINAIGFIICGIINFIGYYFMVIKKEKKNFQMIKKGIAICIITLILSGWFYIRNIILYGSIFGGNVSSEVVKANVSANTSMIDLMNKGGDAISLGATWVKGQIISFCGLFSKEDPLIIKILAAMVLVFVVIEIGICVFCKKHKKKANKKINILRISLIVALVVTVGLDLYYSVCVCFIPFYARYLVPIIISLGLLIIENKNRIKTIKTTKSIIILPSIVIVVLVIFQDIISAYRGI